jgi:WD40 repeat protein
MGTAEALATPYPGLRPFTPEECHLFFGRETQTNELVARLSRQRFVAVVGTSGSGKSSLVLAGLLPALRGGFLQGTTTWHISRLRPGDRPIVRLAEALAANPGFAPATVDRPSQIAWVESTLRRSGLGLTEAIRQAHLPTETSVLVVVDQFEELFRYEPDEAAAFVRLLLEAVHQTDVPIYIVTTMRSDYLGKCPRFRDLPETLNDAQYLVPRMTRAERRLAIEGPARVVGGSISPALVNRLLNDVGDDPGQLPLLQHALMRTWGHWSRLRPATAEVEVDHYLAVGGLAKALDLHADRVYEGLPDDRHRKIAEVVFKRLTERDSEQREVRRPARVDELVAVSGATGQQFACVLNEFRREGRSFLTSSPSDAELTTNPMIDIGHESLIQCWKRLNQWAADEAQSAETFRRLANAAARHAANKADYLRKLDLELALQWRNDNKPTAEWASRYEGDFAQLAAYLEKSEQEQRAARKLARSREMRLEVAIFSAVFIALAALFLFVLSGAIRTRHDQASRFMREALAAASREDAVSAAASFARTAKVGADPLLRLAAWLPWERRPENPTWEGTAAFNVWRYADRVPRLASEVDKHPLVTGVVFSTRGDRLVTWSDDGEVRLWEVRETLFLARSMKHQQISGAGFVGTTTAMITWGRDGTVRLWNAGFERVFVHGRPVKGAVGNTKCQCLAAWSDGQSGFDAAADVGGYGTSGDPRENQADEQALAKATLWHFDRPGGPQRFSQSGSIDLTLSPDGRHVLTWGTAVMPRLRPVIAFEDKPERPTPRDERPYRSVPLPPSVRRAEFSADGKRVLIQTPKSGARLLDTASLSELRNAFQDDESMTDATFIGDSVLTRHEDETRMWRVPGQPPVALPHTAVSSWTVSAGHQYFATGADDGSVRLWRAKDGRQIAELAGGSRLEQVEFGPREVTVLVRSADGRVRVLNLRNGAAALDVMVPDCRRTLLVNDYEVLAWTTQGEVMAYGFRPERPPADVDVEIAALDPVARTVTFVGNGTNGAMRPERNMSSGQVRLHFIRGTSEKAPVLHPRGEYAVRWSKDIPDTGSGLEVSLFRVADGTVVQVLSQTAAAGDQNSAVSGAAFSPDGRHLATWTETMARFWSMDGREARPPVSFQGIKGVAIGNDVSSALVWNERAAVLARRGPAAQVELGFESPISDAVFSADGRWFAVRTISLEARVFDVTGERWLAGFDSDRDIDGAEFTPAGFLTWSKNKTARLFRLSRGSTEVGEQVTFKSATRIQGAAASDDGRVVFTWGAGTANLWNARDGSPASAPFRSVEGLIDAKFTGTGSILMARADGTVGEVGLADYDFAADALPLLASVATGARLDDADVLKALSTSDWAQLRDTLKQKLQEHQRNGSCAHGLAVSRLLARLEDSSANRLAGSTGND